MEHPHIALLRSRILSLHSDERIRRVLLQSIEYFGDQIVAPRRPAPDVGWDNPRTWERAACSGMTERALREKCGV